MDSQSTYPHEPPPAGHVWMAAPTNDRWKAVPASLVPEGKSRGYRVVSPLFTAHTQGAIPQVGPGNPLNVGTAKLTDALLFGMGVNPATEAAGQTVNREALSTLPAVGGALGGAPGAGIGESLRQLGMRGIGLPENDPLAALGGIAAQTGLAKGGELAARGVMAGINKLVPWIGRNLMEGAISAPKWVEEQALGRAPGKAAKPYELVNEMGLSPGKAGPGRYGSTQAGEAGAALHQQAVAAIDAAERKAAAAGKPLVFNAAQDMGKVFDDFVQEHYATVPDYQKAAIARSLQRRFELQHGWSKFRTMTARQVYEMGRTAMNKAAEVLDRASKAGVSVEQLPDRAQIMAEINARLYKRANELLRPLVPGFEQAQAKVQNAMFAKYALLNTEAAAPRPVVQWHGGPALHMIPDRGAAFRTGSAMARPGATDLPAGIAGGSLRAAQLLAQMLLSGQMGNSAGAPPDTTGGQP